MKLMQLMKGAEELNSRAHAGGPIERALWQDWGLRALLVIGVGGVGVVVL